MAQEAERMTALVKTDPSPGMSLDEVPVPEPGPGEVRLQVKSVGIDGGAEALIYDWHPAKHHYEPHLPQIFGHEFAGVVDAVGPDVADAAVGDRVAVEPGITCGRCRNCRAGEPSLCTGDSRRSIGLDVDVDGALAEYVTVPERTVYPFPDSLSYDEGTFLELLGLGVHAVELSDLEPGDRVAVSGPGSVGLSALIAADAAGAREAVMLGAEVDTGSRLPIAAEMGATETLNVEAESIEEEVDVFFEASGHESALAEAVRATRPGGQIVQIGIFHGEDAVPVDLNHLVRSGITYETVYGRRDSSWRRAIALATETDLSPVVGPTFEMADYERAFEAVRDREGIKVTLHP
ncbi:MAG: alcohol dehydrogenase catalytic domain-containing protein [Haloarculaceae archaeon]